MTLYVKIYLPRKGREHRFGGSLPNRFRLLDTGVSELTETETDLVRIRTEELTYHAELSVTRVRQLSVAKTPPTRL